MGIAASSSDVATLTGSPLVAGLRPEALEALLGSDHDTSIRPAERALGQTVSRCLLLVLSTSLFYAGEEGRDTLSLRLQLLEQRMAQDPADDLARSSLASLLFNSSVRDSGNREKALRQLDVQLQELGWSSGASPSNAPRRGARFPRR